MRYAVIPIVFTVAACSATRPATDAGPQIPASVQGTSTGMEVRLNRDERAVSDMVTVSREDAWNALVRTYSVLELPIDVRGSGDGVLATERFRAPRELLDQPLGAFMDCGQGIDGPRVRLWQVRARLVTELEEGDDGVLVSTRLSGTARPRDGTSTDPIACSSTGRLEREIVRLVGEGAAGT